MHDSEGPEWPEQWRRIHRWLQGVRRARDGERLDGGAEDFEDEIYALFQAIWHLKDWLIHDSDPRVGWVTANRVNNFVGKQDEYPKNVLLAAARDLANGTKHLVLNYTPPAEAKPSHGEVALELADDCVMTDSLTVMMTGSDGREIVSATDDAADVSPEVAPAEKQKSRAALFMDVPALAPRQQLGEAADLAERCMAEWEDFLKQHDVPVPPTQ